MLLNSLQKWDGHRAKACMRDADLFFWMKKTETLQKGVSTREARGLCPVRWNQRKCTKVFRSPIPPQALELLTSHKGLGKSRILAKSCLGSLHCVLRRLRGIVKRNGLWHQTHFLQLVSWFHPQEVLWPWAKFLILSVWVFSAVKWA